MKRIPISQTNLYALVDDEDFNLLDRYTWTLDVKGYAQTNFAGTTVKMQRMIMNPAIDDTLHHKNFNRLDNQKDNLVLGTHELCQAGSRKRTEIKGVKTTSIYKGVHWHKQSKSWVARVNHCYKRIFLGRFVNEHDAGRAYNAKAFEVWGSFAKLNVIQEDVVCE